MAEDKWTQKGITFKMVTLDDLEKVKAFLYEAFWADDPIYRSTQLMTGTGYVDKLLIYEFIEMSVKKPLEEGTCMVALDKNGEIIGARYENFIFYL